MLQHGAQKVYSVDVGYGQLDWKLRNDDRVVVMERTNARTLPSDMLGEEISFASIDVSFISVRLILPALHGCLNDGATAVVLVKPQSKRQGKGWQKWRCQRKRNPSGGFKMWQNLHKTTDLR